MTLPVSNVVNVSISLAALAAGPRSFGSLLILGTTAGIISTVERMRKYSSMSDVAKDYGVNHPEYQAALAYFSQSPKPLTLYIGFWSKTETRADQPAPVIPAATPGAVAPAVPTALKSETIQEAVSACLDSLKWYGLVIAADLNHVEVESVARLIEAAAPSRIFGHTTQLREVFDSTSKQDIAYKLSEAKLRRTFVIYSSQSFYAAASLLGRAFSVNFMAANSAITLKFKQLPSIAAEDIKVNEAKSLAAKNCNVYAKYNNDTAILQEGVMSDGSFIDEVHGLDWFQNHLETALWNLYYTSNTKIPQTPSGLNMQCGVLERACEQALRNGLLGAGQWSGEKFGSLESGNYLSNGFYVYSNGLDNQSQADRERRKAPVFQIAAKMAGATHFADVVVSVNR